MRFTEVGQQLRAYRLESGLRAEEIAAQLGVSRAALYRYEKGDVIKLDTIQRLAELLKISPLSLLGMATEYYSRPIAFFERLSQIEETADQLLLVEDSICYLTTSDAFDETLAAVLAEAAPASLEPGAAQVAGAILPLRKRAYGRRRPGIICMLSTGQLRDFLVDGLAPGIGVGERTRRQCRLIAAQEVESLAALMEAEPMGLQIGVIANGEGVNGGFGILRSRDRATVAINPFRADMVSALPGGVAMVTASDEAVAAHQRVAEAQWRGALKGTSAAAHVRALLNEYRPI